MTKSKTCSLHENAAIAPAQREAMLAFIPVLEDPAFCPGHVIPLAEDGLPEEAFIKLVSRFMDACYKNGMVVKFKWEEWDAEAARLRDDPACLEGADLPTLRRLLTWHVRQNRFTRDHVATMIASGHMLAVLKRLKAL